MEDFSIVYFGSGPVSLSSLQLLQANYRVEAIVTKPSTASQMKDACPNTPVFTVSNKAELDALILTRKFTSPVAILIDFGIIVSQQVIDAFPKGIINSHFSLLPEWRGADPITFAILSGQKLTGVSLMLLTAKMDEGPLLAQAAVEIPPTNTTNDLTVSLIELSNELLKTNLPRYVSGELQPYPQNEQKVAPTYSRKLTKADGLIDWGKPATVLEREIRAFNPWPRSYTKLGGVDVIILEARVVTENGTPGTIHANNKQLTIYCGQDALEILHLKPAGKKEMTASAFMAGYGKRLTA